MYDSCFKKILPFFLKFSSFEILSRLIKETLTLMLVQPTLLSYAYFSRCDFSKFEPKFFFPREIFQQPLKNFELLRFPNFLLSDRDDSNSNGGDLQIMKSILFPDIFVLSLLGFSFYPLKIKILKILKFFFSSKSYVIWKRKSLQDQ